MTRVPVLVVGDPKLRTYQTINRGDWVVTNEHGDRSVVDPYSFHLWYERVPDEPASPPLAKASLTSPDGEAVGKHNHLLQTTDSREWAKALAETLDSIVERHEAVKFGELLNTWFANAMMVGFDAGQKSMKNLFADSVQKAMEEVDKQTLNAGWFFEDERGDDVAPLLTTSDHARQFEGVSTSSIESRGREVTMENIAERERMDEEVRRLHGGEATS